MELIRAGGYDLLHSCDCALNIPLFPKLPLRAYITPQNERLLLFNNTLSTATVRLRRMTLKMVKNRKQIRIQKEAISVSSGFTRRSRVKPHKSQSLNMIQIRTAYSVVQIHSVTATYPARNYVHTGWLTCCEVSNTATFEGPPK